MSCVLPLAAVTGYLELLLEFHAQLDPETRTNFLKNAMYGCGELQLLVNNLMDSLQISNEKEILCVEVLSVADVVREVIKYTDPGELQKRCVHLDIPEHLMVQASSQFLRQVLRNLLSNAFKYSPVDTPIVVSALLEDCVAQTTPRPPAVCICVKDSGPGIPPDEISLLFGQFVRLKRDIAGRVRGTGLGLYVSKQLVEAMGGRIWVESTGIPGDGSRFCFTLPHTSTTSNISY
jgi:signal transduction histidine kinase